MKRLTGIAVWVLPAVLAGCPGPKQGAIDEASHMPAKQRMVLLFKSLTYDLNLEKGRSELNVGVVFRDAQKGGALSTLNEIKGVSSLRVRGMQIRGTPLPLTTVAALEKVIADTKVSLLYLEGGLSDVINDICALANVRKLLLLAGDEEYARRCASLTVVKRGRKPRILLNLEAARAQGASFDEPLLRAAELVH